MQSFDISDDYCGSHAMNHPVNGTDVMSLEAAVTWSGAAVTSLAVTTTDQHTVAFVGTENGVVKKVSFIINSNTGTLGFRFYCGVLDVVTTARIQANET